MVTALQRAGGALNTNVHFHTLVLDGVFTEAPGGALAFHPAPGPTGGRYTPGQPEWTVDAGAISGG